MQCTMNEVSLVLLSAPAKIPAKCPTQAADAADVVGYSRLMAANEAATVETLTLERLAPTFLAPYKNASHRDHLRENLVKAGLPE